MNTDFVADFMENMMLLRMQGKHTHDLYSDFKSQLVSMLLRLGIETVWVWGMDNRHVFIFASDANHKFPVGEYRWSLESVLEEVYGDLGFREHIISLVYLTDEERKLLVEALMRYAEA